MHLPFLVLFATISPILAHGSDMLYESFGQLRSGIKPGNDVHWYNKARVQYPAPSWQAEAVINDKFETLSLKDYAGKWLLMFFYPLDFTFVCPTEIVGYSDAAPEFRKLNCEVVGVSVDSKYSHLAWTKQPRSSGGVGSLNIPLVSDFTKTIASDYGVLVETGPDAGVALRGTFIIDPSGKLRHISINDLPVGRSIEESLRLVEAFQAAERSGEVCAVGWKKGDQMIKPDPLGSKEYFQTVF